MPFARTSPRTPRPTARARARLGLSIALIFALLPARAALAAPQVEVKMSARPEIVSVGDQVQLEIRVDALGGRIDRVELPDLGAFSILSHRRSSPVRFQFGLRGAAQVEATEIHQFTLRAELPGEHRLAAPVAMVEGERYEGTPVTIRVEGDPRGAPDVRSSEPLDDDPVSTPLDDVFDARAFLRAKVDRTEVYVGEQITLEIEYYSRLRGSPRFSKEPSTDGFWVHDLLDPNRPPPERREIVRGVPFQVYTVKRVAAFPLRAGKLDIGAATLEIVATTAFGFAQGEKLVRHAKPVTITVKPLPNGTPSRALVGQFDLRANIDRRTLRVGEAATLEVVVEGRGHVRDLELGLPEIRGLRVLAPETETSTRIQNGRLHGRRVTRFLIIAEQPGTFRIPGFSVPTFDPETETSQRLTSNAVVIHVAGDDGAIPDEPPIASEPDELEPPASDSEELGVLRGRADLRRRSSALADRGTFWALLLAPPVVLALAFGFGALARRRRKERGRRERERRHQRLLDEARAKRREGDAKGLYAALASSIHAALEELLGESTRGLTHAEIAQKLAAVGAPNELVTRTIEELEGLDFARFAAESTHAEEMDRAMLRITAILDRLDALAKGGRA